jgi:hypothetical protein
VRGVATCREQWPSPGFLPGKGVGVLPRAPARGKGRFLALMRLGASVVMAGLVPATHVAPPQRWVRRLLREAAKD